MMLRFKLGLNKGMYGVLLGQHEPAPTSTPVGNSALWMGWDFSSSEWMCVDLCWPSWCWPFIWVFLFSFFFVGGCFFLNFEISCPATYYLPSWPYFLTKNQPHPLLIYLTTRYTPPFPTWICHFFLTYLPTQHLHNINNTQWK